MAPILAPRVSALIAGALSLAAGLLAPPAPIPAAAGPDPCTWRLSSVRLYEELAGQTDTRAVILRGLMASSGVAEPGFLPASCTAGAAATPSRATGSAASGGAPAGAPTGSGSSSGSCATTAAATYRWGTPNRDDEFTDPSDAHGWGLYDGPGHAGNGRRSPSAASIANGVLTITGDSSGTTEGMAWTPGQRYGRWEACVRSPASAPAYHSLLLLWPDAENFPVGGEVDFMEIGEPARQSIDLFLHYGADNSQDHGNVTIDATRWHAWAVEWTPDHLTAYVDGHPWWTTTDTSHLPPGPMHLCIQLDYFPGDGTAAGGGQEVVDWARQYPAPGDTTGSSGGSAAAAGGPG